MIYVVEFESGSVIFFLRAGEEFGVVPKFADFMISLGSEKAVAILEDFRSKN